MARIELDRVVKQYADGYVAVDDVSFDIEDGELMILVGPSGCGKSTLLRMIAGLEDPTSGELRIGGERINDKPPHERDLAMVFQNYALYPHLSVFENIAFPLRLRKLPEREVRTAVERAAAMLELTPQLTRRPSQLSGGQRQRVAMGRAFVRDAKAFLFDEPLSNLDARLRAQMRVEIARLQRRLGTTTLYVTHDQTEAMTLGDRVAVLRAGVLQQCATPRELYEQPANLFVAGFIGAPTMSFTPAHCENGELRLPFVTVPLPPATEPAALDGRSLVAGLRPDAFARTRLGASGSARHGEFAAMVDLIEWLGTDQYAYVPYELAPSLHAGLAALAERLGHDAVRPQLIVSLDPADRVLEGSTLTLSIDSSKVYLFDARTGRNVRASADGRQHNGIE